MPLYVNHVSIKHLYYLNFVPIRHFLHIWHSGCNTPIPSEVFVQLFFFWLNINLVDRLKLIVFFCQYIYIGFIDYYF